MTAAITWAVLATVGAVAVYWLMRREVCDSRAKFKRVQWLWSEDINNLCDQRDRAWLERSEAQLALAEYRANEQARTSAHMREIGIRGNKSPKRKAAVQRLQVVGKAAEINREMGR